MSGLAMFLNFLFLALGLFMLVKGADWFVDGASSIAEKFHVPQIVIGLTIVAFGTSLPEAAVSINAAIQGSGAIAIGNVLGSNIANVLLILGICGLIAPLAIQKNTLWIEIPFVVVITVALLLLGCFDNSLGRSDGGVLIAFFVLFLAYLVWITVRDFKTNKARMQIDGVLASQELQNSKHGTTHQNVEFNINCDKIAINCDKTIAMPVIQKNAENGDFSVNNGSNSDKNSDCDTNLTENKNLKNRYKAAKAKFESLAKSNIWIMLLLVVAGGAMIVFGSSFVVDTAKALAVSWGMSESFIALTIVAIGTSLPELVTSIVAARKNKADLAIGNIVGSNIFNILFILGTASLISPLQFQKSFIIDSIIAIAAMILLFVCVAFTKDQKLKRVGGGIMLAGYIGYFAYLITTIV